MRELALENEILRGVVGSTAHGTAIEGQDDRDEMGVCFEPPEYVIGLKKFEQYIYRDKPEGVRSEPGDLDLTIYSLRKFVRLAAKGNPSVLVLLWLPEYIKKTEAGQKLLDIRSEFVSKEAGKRFLGYLVSQKRALKGERTKKVSRPELVEKYGYDTKFAMHAVRLGLQGHEYLTEGRLSIPMQSGDLSLCRIVREGKISLNEVLFQIEELEFLLQRAIEGCQLKVNYDKINKYLVREYQLHWVRTTGFYLWDIGD